MTAIHSHAPIPLALFGMGVIGRTHVERIGAHPRLVLSGIADPSSLARETAKAIGVPHFDSPHALLAAQRPAGVVVATPNGQHVPQALACLAEGIPVLVEKPISDSVEVAVTLAEAADRVGIPVLVGQHRRHNPIQERARECVASGQLGRVLTAQAMATVYKPDAYFDLAWRRQPGGGPILINLIHEIDQLRDLLGEVRSVQALASTQARGFEVEDTAAALLQFECGTLATLLLSDSVVSPWCWDFLAGEQAQYPQQAGAAIHLGGTLGALSLPDLAMWRYAGERHWHRELLREERRVHRADPYARQLAHFVDLIEGCATPRCSAWDGARTLQATLAVAEAARSGHAIQLPPLGSVRSDAHGASAGQARKDKT